MPNKMTSSRIHALLVDDDADDLLILRDLLKERFGSEISFDNARNRAEALERVRCTHYDIAIIDYLLGPDSGLELISEIHRQQRHTPCIILTGQGDSHVDQQALEHGAADYIAKSEMDSERLARAVRYSINQSIVAENIERTERQYRQLFANSPIALLVVDEASGNLLDINIHAGQLYGITSEEVAGIRFSDLLSPEPETRLQSIVDQEILSSIGSGGEIQLHQSQSDGELVVEVYSYLIELGDTPARVYIVVDLSARLEERRALFDRQQMIDKVIKDSRDGFLVLDTDQRVIFSNSKADDMLGNGVALTGSYAGSFLPEDGKEHISLNSPRGEEHFEVTVSASEWEGNPATIITLRNITARLEAEHIARLLNQAVESSVNGVFIVDIQGDQYPIVYCNGAFAKITGYRADEVLGHDWRFLYRESGQQDTADDLNRRLAAGTPFRTTLLNQRKDGVSFWNELSVSPVFSEAGKITNFIGVINDVTELKESERALEFSESHDLLTGLINRSELDRRIHASTTLNQHGTGISAALYIDIDQFKPINDSLGHRIGDRLLKQIALRLRSLVRSDDTVARVGGDEFVVFLGQIKSEQDAVEFAERVLERFEEPFVLDNRGRLFITCSIGISTLVAGERGQRFLVQEADVAMSHAKKAGRNTYYSYVVGLESEQRRHTTLRSQLRDALSENQFYLAYQPQIDTLNGRVSAFEALLRWNHPEMGELAPGEFIPIAEQSGVIVDIGRWVLREACRFNKCLIDQRISDVPVAVNISGFQFVRPNFVDEVFSVLEDVGLPANRLELEITESSMMEDALHTTEKLLALGDAGIELAIDDFGTGYSSLSYLRTFPINKLKIDKSFIDNVTDNSGDAGIVLATIAMAHHLGMSVVAEGVEREAQANFLRRHQCEQLQGYYFARPMKGEKLIEYLRGGDQHMARAQHDSIPVRTVLIVDDEPNILRALSRTLRREGYRVLQADSGPQAFDVLASEDVQVIISDQRMPEMSGTEFLSQVKEIYPQVVRIILSGYTELSAVTDAINRGAIYRFLTKPWEDDQLRTNVREAFRKYERDTRNASE